MTIPSSALTKQGGKDVVFVVSGTIFKARIVMATVSGTGDVLITQGLQPNERVATSGLTELKMLLGGE